MANNQQAILSNSIASMAASDVKAHVNHLYGNLQKILYFSEQSKNIDFYLSALTELNPFHSTEEIGDWLKSLNGVQRFEVTHIPLAEMRKWKFDQDTGDLLHESGGFFSIRGLDVKTNVGPIQRWSQPIIHQPEIGVLGIITKKVNGILYFLMQAKAEPGNINTYQLSPTVQATRSNYLRLHGGKPTLYLEYFLEKGRAQVLVDQLQSEQGARFYHKRNRNIIVRIADDEEIELSPYHRWLTMGQLVHFVQQDNVGNMDTRSVISGISFEPEEVNSQQCVDKTALHDALEHSPIVSKPVSDLGVEMIFSNHSNTKPINSMDQLLQEITAEKFSCQIEAELIPLKKVLGWQQTADEIFHEQRKYFSIIGVRVETISREVTSWDQPIVRQQHPGLVGFMVKQIDGVTHFLTQLKMESGVMDLLEIAPTVQCITDNYSHPNLPPFVGDFLEEKRGEIAVKVCQSEEGGRFYQESNENILMLANDDFPSKEPPKYKWMSLRQLKHLIRFNNYLNVEARSLLSCLPWK